MRSVGLQVTRSTHKNLHFCILPTRRGGWNLKMQYYLWLLQKNVIVRYDPAKHVWGLYDGDHRPLGKEVRGKHQPAERPAVSLHWRSWQNNNAILKMICRFNAVPVKTPSRFFVHMNGLIIKFIRKHTGPRMATIILKKKNKEGEPVILAMLRIYQVATFLKSAQSWWDGQTHRPWNRIEDQKQTNENILHWCFTKVQTWFSKGRTVSCTLVLQKLDIQGHTHTN